MANLKKKKRNNLQNSLEKKLISAPNSCYWLNDTTKQTLNKVVKNARISNAKEIIKYFCEKKNKFELKKNNNNNNKNNNKTSIRKQFVLEILKSPSDKMC